MGSGASRGTLSVETSPHGRPAYFYEYGGRRYDVTAFLERHRRANDTRRREARPPPESRPDTGTGNGSVGNGTDTTPEKPDKPTNFPISRIDVTSFLKTNRKDHHTSEYENKDLIIRRGQPFLFAARFKRPYNKDYDRISLEFNTGIVPSYSKGTKVRFAIGETLEDGKWGAVVESVDGKKVTFKAQSAANAPIGHYTFSVISMVEDVTGSESSRIYPEKLYIIFNPWCKQDVVYMDKEEELEEYVLNETGYQFYGNWKRVGKRRWNFGQFDDASFNAAIYLLQDCRAVVDYERNNPVVISRKMSAAVNVQDDGGILVGNWSGNYDDGTRPTKWNGSVAILEEFMKNKQPVKYGQCWVFSGVLTTILRSLGIPARSVTNYASAHDTDSSMTIDKHVDQDGEPIKWMDSDSVWNFHVWNDCWMTRPDLPPGYGGWQAVDSTPQETSEGFFQTGPASLNAIKQGHVYLPYDTKFVFAEINGDKIYWEVTDSGEFPEDNLKKIKVEKSSIGRGLYTKAVGKFDGIDVRGEYKYPEHSNEERIAVEAAVEHGTKPDTYVPDATDDDDISADIVVDEDDKLVVGDDIDIAINLKNKSSDNRTVKLTVVVQMCYYTGVLAEKVVKEQRSVTIDGNQAKPTVIKVKADEYVDSLVDQSAMKIFLLGRVQETKQILVDQDDFRLRTPDLDVSVSSTSLKVGQEFTVTVGLKNPLPRTLRKCSLNFEGAGLQRPRVMKLKDVRPKGEIKQQITLRAMKPGNRTLVVDFDSDQLSQVHGDVDVEVTE